MAAPFSLNRENGGAASPEYRKHLTVFTIFVIATHYLLPPKLPPERT